MEKVTISHERASEPPLKFFETPEELRLAEAFDTSVFESTRETMDGESVTQATIEPGYLDRVVADGGRVFGYTGEAGEIIALAIIVMSPDTSAEEPLIRNLGLDDAYFQGLAVHEDHRGKGLGHMLANKGLEIARSAGKTRMITTIHPNNVQSLRTFLGAGFVGISIQQIYYDLPDNDGARLIMIRDELDDPHWNQRVIPDPTTELSLSVNELFTADGEKISDKLRTLEMGYCLYDVTKGSDDGYTLEIAPYQGDWTYIPKLLYPYNSLIEGYEEARETVDPPPFCQYITERILTYFDAFKTWDGLVIPNSPDHLLASENQVKWLSVDWLKQYQKRLVANKSFNLLPPQGGVDTRARLDHFKFDFLLTENRMLRSFISTLPPRYALRREAEAALNQRGSIAASSDLDRLLYYLGDENTHLYQILSQETASDLLRAARLYKIASQLGKWAHISYRFLDIFHH